MANFLSLSLSFLLLFNGCLALQPFQQQNKCQFQNIDALEPIEIAQAEGGYSVFFDSNDQQFQCAGVEIFRHHIKPQGLFLPSYFNSPLLIYILQGNGYQGVMLPGCPETFESPQQSGSFQDRHQKIHRFVQGDVIVIPTGAAHWMYNDGQQELIALVFIDSTNQANQLDQFNRHFFLAGNPNEQQQQPLQPQKRATSRRQKGTSSDEGFGNIFQGFDLNMLAEVFNVDQETAQKLQSLDDTRGHIVMMQRGLQVVQPPITSRQQGQQIGGSNGVEETVCSGRISLNINDVSRADVYNPLGGWTSTLGSIKLPILGMVNLSVQRGVLNTNAVISPYWVTSAHSVMYVTQGYMKMQIINNKGQAVYNGEIREGQLVVMPQNFAVGKQAGPEGCQWISFRTNDVDSAIVNNLAGRTSFIRGMPVDVIMNMYQMSLEEAKSLKYNQNELMVFTPK